MKPLFSTELLAGYRRLSQQVLTVVDVETTGRYASTDRITEVSVLQATLADGIQQQRTHLINPQMQIPAKISQFTGISQKMVEAALPAADILPEYLPTLGQGILTAHNLEFDYAFLQAEYGRLAIDFSRTEAEQLCTVKLARLMLPDLPSRRLPDLVRHFKFEVDTSHRAEADTLACWLLAKQLLTEILNEADETLQERFGRQWIPLAYAAGLLGHTETEGRSRLTKAGIPARFSGRGKGGTWMYPRGEVERLAQEQEDTQLSLL